ncbi:hypothetical protein Scep_010745 [Stephania cephalantha]|uniref:Cytochrome b561 and DOMON domain-containing protein n=1 Tax=Stephania cephalantha TaxID=152367 RepID=A0AAP0JWF6_9MAGN
MASSIHNAPFTSLFLHFSSLLLLLLLLLLLFPCCYCSDHSLALTCTTQSSILPKNTLYAHCLDLPRLRSYLHWTYNPANATLDVAFIAAPDKPTGWIAWAINPTSDGMLGAQALIAYNLGNGSIGVDTFNVSSYKGVLPSRIAFDMLEKGAVGGSVTNGVPNIHQFKLENLNSKGKLDLMNGSGGDVVEDGGSDSRVKKKNIHGVLNAVSWGILFPIGAIIARYVRVFESADPAWFYLHASCQVSGYILGVSGWATGLKLGSQSKGVVYSTHRNIGIVLFILATLQIFALFLRPKQDHKFRVYWNVYHHGVGYAILVLGIINVFKGLRILEPGDKWVTTYITVISVLGGIALFLEVVTWIMVFKRKSNKSTKPYDGNGA